MAETAAKRRADLEAILQDRRDRLDGARQIERRVGAVTVFAFLLFTTLLILSLDNLLGLTLWLTVPLLGGSMALLVPWRERLTRERRRAEHAVDWVVEGIDRLDDRLEPPEMGGQDYEDPDHPFAQDLDLFGPVSLFARLNSCRTPIGRDALAARLLETDVPDADEIRERQAAVRELQDDLALREILRVELEELLHAGRGSDREKEQLDAQTRALVAWGEEEVPPEPGTGRVFLWVLLAVAATGICTAVLFWGLPVSFILPFYALNGWLLYRIPEADTLVTRFEMVRKTLNAWSRVLSRIEGVEFETARLRELQERLRGGAAPASRAIVRLKRYADRLSQRRNIFWLLTVDVLWLLDLHILRRLSAWHRTHGPHIRDWFEAAAELEALCAIGAYAHGHPDSAYPEVVEESPILDGENLAHPLLPRDARVGNDIRVDEEREILIVTGSNMSGKSTFLRSVGLAVVMARLGSPVVCDRLTLRPMALATCMRVTDSLARGASLFQAEVRRLKVCTEWAEEPDRTTLVLLDEILAGTNSRERHEGALAVLRTLAGLNTMTLCSTHDLGLADIAGQIESPVRVVHFTDDVRQGEMHFDYQLREGPLPSTNALRVMRMAGLDVPEEE